MVTRRPPDIRMPHMRPARVTVIISSTALTVIREEIQNTSPAVETGGILLGTSDPLRVTVAGDAGPGAVRTPTFFLRDLDHAQHLAAVEAEHSGAQWIGEWHTHPTGPPHPSPADLATYLRLQHQPSGTLGSGVLSLIISPHAGSLALTAWVCIDGTGTQLEVETS
jgi:integrative and conjugative element protein (TIGR02256 family)